MILPRATCSWVNIFVDSGITLLSGKDWDQWSPDQSDFAAVGTNCWFVWAWSLQSFFFIRSVTDGVLAPPPFPCRRRHLACSVGDTSFTVISQTWLHRYYLIWTEMDDAITKFNNENWTENWVLNLVILHWHAIFLFWYCAVALIQFVLLKALYK